MSEALDNRAALIRRDLETAGVKLDPALTYKYSKVASRWDWLRLRRSQGFTTPADDRRYAELTAVLRVLTEKLGLEGVATEDDRAEDSVPGITVSWGAWLPHDWTYLIAGQTWKDSAEGY